MSGRPVSRAMTRVLLTGVVCLGASACSASTSATPGFTRPPTTPSAPATIGPAPAPAPATPATAAAPATAPPTIRTGPGTQAAYAVQAQPAPGSCHYRTEGGAPLPDPSCTPGAVNPQVTQADLATTICRSGWTATVRPPASVTGPEKVASARAYGYAGSFATGEYDHLIPLELGGDPNDPANLWLQPNDNPNATSTHNAKDGLENTLKGLVCSGSLTLAGAQQAIATDWVAAAARYPG
jgi:hypothetical protein